MEFLSSSSTLEFSLKHLEAAFSRYQAVKEKVGGILQANWSSFQKWVLLSGSRKEGRSADSVSFKGKSLSRFYTRFSLLDILNSAFATLEFYSLSCYFSPRGSWTFLLNCRYFFRLFCDSGTTLKSEIFCNRCSWSTNSASAYNASKISLDRDSQVYTSSRIPQDQFCYSIFCKAHSCSSYKQSFKTYL